MLAYHIISVKEFSIQMLKKSNFRLKQQQQQYKMLEEGVLKVG